MIITCAECATQFQLEEERVPESGIRVRCSICKHAFFVAHPDAFEQDSRDPVERAVSGVLATEPGGLPEASEDLAGAPPAPGAGGADEESWEFGEGALPAYPDGSDARDRFEESFEAARDAVDDLLGSPWQPPAPDPADDPLAREVAALDRSAPQGGIDRLAWNEPAPEPAELDDPWEKPAWSDEAPGALAELPEQEAPPGGDAPAAEGSPAADLELDVAAASPWWERDLPDSDGPPPQEDASPEAGASDLAEADDPYDDDALGEALDAFESAEDGHPAPPETDLSDADATREVGTSEDWGLALSGDSAQGEVAQVAAPADGEREAAGLLSIEFAAPTHPETRRGSVFVWLARAGNGLGWGAVAILAAVTLWGSVAPRTDPARGPSVQALAGLEASGVSGRWIENASLGSLYVVSGELRNPGSETRTPGSRLVVRLLDADGVELGEAAASLGPPLGAPVLHAAGPEDLRAAGELGARELARTRVAPGSGIRFEAVVLDLPPDAQRFELAEAP